MAETSISGIEFKIVGSTTRARSSVDKLVTSLKGLKTALNSARTAKLEKELEGIDKNAKKSTTTLGKLFKSIGRIGFYRAIRSALRFITEGFREGLQNAYQFSKMVGYELAGTMDTLATKSLTMKNQLGSAFGGLIQTLEPILIQIISLVTKAANALAQLFAIIGGRKTYLKAVDTMTQFGEAVGGAGQAAKEAMRYLAPFDELNVLPADNAGGGGGGGASTPDYSSMFEVTDVDADSILGSLANMYNSMADWFESQDWKSLGSSVWKGLKDAFSDEGKAKDVVQALFRMIGSVTGAATGFVWGFVSEAVESIMQSFKDSIRDYNGDNKIGITDILTGIWNFAISPFVWIDENIVKPFWRGFTGALLGEEREPLTINDVLGKLPTDKEWTDWGKNIWKKFKEGIESGWKSIKEGWADFKEELYNIFIKPIVDAFDEFAEKHPKVAKLLGIENGSSDVLAPGAAAAESMWGGTLELDAEVTDVKDSIPKEKKTIKDFFADLFGTKDSVPKEKKTLGNFFADLFGVKDSVPGEKKTLKNFIADLFKPKDSIPEAQKTIQTTANMTKRNVGDKVKASINVVADFVRRTVGDKVKAAIDTTANFTKRRVGKLNKVIDTTSNFKKRNTGELNKVIDTTSNFKWWQNGLNGTPVLNTEAKITKTYVDPVLGKPTIDVNARITGSLGNYTMATGGAYYGNSWHGIPQAAAGGKFHGTLFWAGESGAEVVGHAGGRTEVLNRSQLAATMYAAVHSAMSGVSFQLSGMRTPESVDGGYDEETLYRAMLRALNDSDVADSEITLDGDVLYRKMVQRNQMNTRMTGRNVMATA